ncbi:M20/M25/M40 family metallo-hydrolase [Spirosoma sp. KUDC1026]|uniref:M20/M25/M40 family metallo-hydrolase n=1 Tax=Spirosoma sp. KUDC1026 TaxID=2745947 RepID=UPI00159BD3CC|nr:M20/M25/M40 family metallo-hydrolase [Spirosoma sp. KUDC1026]QKZ15054.1 M20/M25/M40 family metallo-hydrolase [Spirosoma sp. KUDC1026]
MKKLVLFLLLGGCSTYAQSLTKPESTLVATVKKQMPETEAFLEKVVNINSGSLNKEGVRQVGNLMGDEFKKLGFTVEWVTLPDSLNRAGHLVATRQGKKGKKLFLIGHLDTVFEKSLPMEPYTHTSDSTITGQGVNDIKGGDVMIIAALKAMQQQQLLDDTNITVYLTGDEESGGGMASRLDFIERAKRCDLALAFETAQGLNLVTTGRRGSSSWTLDVRARSGHSSRIFSDLGYGAIYEAARILTEFRRVLGQEQYLTFNPGLIVGGADVKYDDKTAEARAVGKTNIIAGSALVKGDLRFLGEAQKEKARVRMHEIVSKSLPLTGSKITFVDGIPSMEPTAANDKLRLEVDKVSRDMGLGPVAAGDPGSRGAGDVSFIAEYLPCIDGLGASGKGAHSIEETMNSKEYPLLIQRTAVLLYRLTR